MSFDVVTFGNMLDTNIIIRYLKNDTAIVPVLDTLDSVLLSVTTVGELLYGAEYSQKKEQNRFLYESFCSSFPVIETTVPIAKEYGKIAAYMKQHGTPIPMNDMWIAAAAIANNLRLITADKHFEHIPNLNVLIVS